MNNKFVIIHGHFYQPPRENAWLDQIEIQESAAPHHDWNERISKECYAPNGVSRILNSDGKIVDIVNNYARMSFNFGPTLLTWLEQHEPKVYQQILEADRLSLELFDGHGSAIAQVYNHIIMPLASRADKETQVRWGIYDFEKRFQRKPEGMWLAETAVDTETLEVLAENDIAFTILAPNQAKRYRKLGSQKWQDGIDSTQPYICKLPSGKKITLFFYDGDKSQGVAFKGYLNDGNFFANQLLEAFNEKEEQPKLVNIATDGESYGHHHKNGDMALAYCVRHIEENSDATITNYSQYMRLVKPEYEVEIHEASSWSCAHGVERWRSNCGCETGGQVGWNQEWRVGLRNAIDWLRNAFDKQFEEVISAYHSHPWELRNHFIEVIQNRNESNIDAFVKKHIKQKLTEEQTTEIIRMLEMEKNSLFMQTSCGWFFNELSGIETVQILQYANRGIQLAEDVRDVDFEAGFLERLAQAKSNLKEHGTGADIYKKFVKPKRLSLTQVGMHYAVSTLFEEDAKKVTVLNYDCESTKSWHKKAGPYILSVGATEVRSRVTRSYKKFYFAILYLGNHHLIGSTTNKLTEAEFDSIVAQIGPSFNAGNIAECIDIIKWNFQDRSFSFFNLFKDQQLELLESLTDYYEGLAMDSYDSIYEKSYSMLNVMLAEGHNIPPMLQRNLENIFQFKLEEILNHETKKFSLGRLQRYADEVKKWKVKLNKERIVYNANAFINFQIEGYQVYENKLKWAERAIRFLNILHGIEVYPNINVMQDFVFRLTKENHLEEDVRNKMLMLAELINLKLPENKIASES